jgi:hypothetical protein
MWIVGTGTPGLAYGDRIVRYEDFKSARRAPVSNLPAARDTAAIAAAVTALLFTYCTFAAVLAWAGCATDTNCVACSTP